MSNIKFFTFYTPNTQKNLRINVLNSIGMVRYKCYFLFIHVLFFLSLIQQNISSFSLSTTHYFLPHSLSLRLLISSSNFCEPTLIFIPTIFITQILASLIFISISLTEFFFFNLHLPHRFLFSFFHSLLSVLISELKQWQFGFGSLCGLDHLKAKRIKVSFWVLYFGVADLLKVSPILLVSPILSSSTYR